MTIMDSMLSMYAIPKIVIKNAAHAILPKNTVNIITISFKVNATLKTVAFNLKDVVSDLFAIPFFRQKQ